MRVASRPQIGLVFGFLAAGNGLIHAADSVNWRFWDAGDGMVESYVSSLTASPDGTLVLRHGAVESMELLDGYRLAPMADPRSLGRIYRDAAGNLYGFDARGLHRRHGTSWSTTPVAAFSGLSSFNRFQNFRSFLYSTDEGMELEHRVAILPFGAGQLIAMFPDRLEEWRFADGGDRGTLVGIVRRTDQTALGEFIDIEPAGPDGIWIAAERGVAQLRREGPGWTWKEWPGPPNMRRFTYPSMTPSGAILVSAAGTDGKNRVLEEWNGNWEVQYVGQVGAVRAWTADNRVWIKDGDRLLNLKNDAERTVARADREPRISGLISDILPQAAGAYWLATSQVLARYAPALWQAPAGSGMEGNDGVPVVDETVNAINEDEQGRVWFSAGHRLLRFGADGWKTLTLPDRQDTVATKSICPLPGGRMIVATDNSSRLWSVDAGTLSAKEIRHPEARHFGWIQPRDRNSIWVQTRIAGAATSRVEVFDGTTFKPFAGLEAIPILDLRGVMEAKDGSVWAGGVEGLGVLRGGKFTLVQKQEGLGERDAFALFQTSRGEILVGHRDELSLYDGKHFRPLHNRMNRARTMIETADGTVWIASGSGIHRWRPDAWITNASQEGLPSSAVYTVFRDRTGRIWAGTTLGISLFHPEADHDPPMTSILEDRNVHQVSPNGEARLSFRGRDRWKFTPDDRLLFSWRVDGGVWSPFAEQSFAALNALRSGNHLFEVRAMDRNGNSDPHPASYSFLVTPPWYREGGFFVIASFAALALFGVGRAAINYHSSLRFQIRHDALTGLLNRMAFEGELESALAKGRRTDTTVALMLLDLDGFKQVNDLYGHLAGDALLASVSRRISICLSENDLLARLGGDEFGVLLAPGTKRENIIVLAGRLLDEIRNISTIEDRPVKMSASIGISLFPEHADTATALLRLADVAMYQSKARNKDCFVLFDPEIARVNFSASQIAGKLRTALAEDGLRLLFQPIVDSHGTVAHMEALVRVYDSEAGLILPEAFIRVAEDTNLISELGLWVLVQSCRQLRSWLNAGLAITVAVNVSPIQLEDAGFLESVLDTIEANGLPAGSIAIEVTEQTLIRDKDRVRRVIAQLRAAGVRVSLDDFGAGYSSLDALNTLAIDCIKIDRSLVHAVNVNEGMREVVREIIAVAHAFGMSVTAEGIEDAEQMELLLDLKCDFFQGYHLARPLEAEAAGEFASRGRVAVERRR